MSCKGSHSIGRYTVPRDFLWEVGGGGGGGGGGGARGSPVFGCIEDFLDC